MNPNELELWHQHYEELVREAENGRLTRRLNAKTDRVKARTDHAS